VSNLHSHARPLLAYLRLLGVEPGSAGELRTGAGASFQGQVLTLRADGSGQLNPTGEVTVHAAGGQRVARAGTVTW